MKIHHNLIITIILLMIQTSMILYANPIKETDDSSSQKVIFVSIPPLQYFVERISNNTIPVEIILNEGQNGERYELTPQQLFGLEQSQGFFVIGLPYEKKVINRLQEQDYNNIVLVGSSVNRIPFSETITYEEEEHEEDTHEEEEHEEDTHEEEEHEMEDDHEVHHHDDAEDPHVWMSIENNFSIISDILGALVSWYPDSEDLFTQNYNQLVGEIEELQQYANVELKPCSGKGVLLYHPVLSYFAQEFNFTQHSIQWKGQERSIQQIQNIMTHADDIRAIFVQEGFPTNIVESMSEKLQLPVGTINPLRKTWDSGMYAFIDELSHACAQ